MLPHLTVRGERRISIPQGELVHMEQALLSSWDMLDFLFWFLFCVFFTSDSDLSTQEPMLQELVLSFQRTMMSQARFTAFALANMRAVRREAYLPHLPHHLTSVSKAQLYQSNMDSDLILWTRPSVKSSRLLRCHTLRPRPRCLLN